MFMDASIFLFLMFGFLLLWNTPIAVGLAMASLLTMFLNDAPMAVFPLTMYSATAKFALLAIPFFILAGVVMEAAGVSSRLIKFANVCVGHTTGGLAIVAIVTCCFFAAISGSGPATVAALGSILIPAMVKAGYDKGFSCALMANAGAIGIIIPPSIAFVVYGVIAEVSIGKLFMAGVVPGLLVGLALAVVSYIVSKKRGYGGSGKKATAAEIWFAFKDAAWGLMTPVIILGGIYGGVFTPTEASAVAVFYALVVGVVIYREIKIKDLYAILRKSAISSAVIMFIIANAGLFAFLITRAGVPDAIGRWLEAVLQSPALFLLGVNAALFIIGMFIETSAAIIVLAPILAPVAMHFGIDPVHFGLIMVVNLALGMITPPFGVNLFAACTVAKISLDRIIKHLLPFVGVILVCLLVITYVPSISLTLRDLVYAK